jgi:glutamyl-tRNA synthetase
VQERIDTLEGFFEYASFFFVGEVAYDEAALRAMVAKGRTPADTARVLRALLEEVVDPILDWDEATVEAAFRGFGEKLGWAPNELFMAVRVAATGRAASPPLFATLAVLGKETCRRRLRRAAEALKTGATGK